MRKTEMRCPGAERGLTLVELMIALILGLIVIGAAWAIFRSSEQTSRTASAMGEIQNAAVFSFEMLGRDIREAGSNPCDATLPATAILTASSAATPTGTGWFLDWATPLYGFEGAGPSGLIHQAGTDVLQVLRGGDDVKTLTVDMVAGATSVSFAPAQPGFSVSQPLMLCDGEVVRIFGATSVGAGTVGFGGGGLNACAFFPRLNAAACGGTAAADGYLFKKFSHLTSVYGVRWFTRDIDGTSALFRQVGGNAAEEVVRGVGGLQLWYLHNGTYKTAAQVTADNAWSEVSAVRVRMQVREENASGTTGTAAQSVVRPVEHVFALRNRLL